MEIRNPVLPGFNPDPSIVRAGDDFYIATSTFQWFPGVRIHHSRDLVHWRLIGGVLNRRSQLDLRGVPDSGGVWAPCLSYDGGRFYLVYTNVKRIDPFAMTFDVSNYLSTSSDPAGDWSEPVYLNSSGFDPSLFHDTDGRKWVLNMVWRNGKAKKPFGGILIQELCQKNHQLKGEPRLIFEGTALGSTEGPHLYRKDGFYYLVTAEGGTSYGHAVSVARSRDILGPYLVAPGNPVLTSKDDASLEIQKAGHASLTSLQNGEWFMAHLGARPLSARGRCPLGRESCLQRIEWKGGWPRMELGAKTPSLSLRAPELKACEWDKSPERDDFDGDRLDPEWSLLRGDEGGLPEILEKRKGFLTLKGKSALTSLQGASLIARRQTAFCFTAQTCVECRPAVAGQTAGLVYYYDTANFYYLRMAAGPRGEGLVELIQCDHGNVLKPEGAPAVDAQGARVFLRAEVRREDLALSVSRNGSDWTRIAGGLDASKISDEYAGHFAFTGAFIGMACEDPAGAGLRAYFDYFDYRPA